MAKKICSELMLNWTAIDWRRNSRGEYFFLEANPSPMFIGFSMKTGMAVYKMLAKALARTHQK